MVQLLAASACRGQFSSSMPESYSSSAVSLAGALKFKWTLQFRFHTNTTLKTEWVELQGIWSQIWHTCSPAQQRDSDLIYLGWDFPWTTSLSSSTAMMSECGTSNMGSRRSFSYWEKKCYCVTLLEPDWYFFDMRVKKKSEIYILANIHTIFARRHALKAGYFTVK